MISTFQQLLMYMGRLMPTIFAGMLMSSSIFNSDLRGLVFLIGILVCFCINSLLSFFLSETLGVSLREECKIMNLNNNSLTTFFPLSSITLGFCAGSLIFPMHDVQGDQLFHNGHGIGVLLFYLFASLGDIFIHTQFEKSDSEKSCFSCNKTNDLTDMLGMPILTGFIVVIANLLGVFISYIYYLMLRKNANLLFYSNNPSSPMCNTMKQKFQCQVTTPPL